MHSFLIPALLLQGSLTQTIDKQIADQAAFKGAWVGVVVMRPDGRVLYQRNANTRFVPASNQKVISSLFALHRLGPDFQQSTRIWATTDATYIDAPGDPTLTREQWLAAAQTLAAEARGSVWVRQAYREGVPDTWEFDDLVNRYAPRITALSMDRAGFELWAENGELRPLPAEYGVKITREPDSGGARMVYNALTGELRVLGTLPTAPTQLDTYAQPEPDQAVARVFGSELRPTEEMPAGEPTFVIKSPKLIDMVRDCLQPSDNLYGEHLLLMGATKNGKSSYPVARTAAEEFMERTVGAGDKAFVAMDGSGLSRHNLITPHALARTFRWADKQPWSEAFRAGLARPGVGTLRTRLEGVSFEGKTGTLNSVNSLSGYLRTKEGRELIVVVMVNHTTASSSAVRSGIDRIYRTLENTSLAGTQLGVQ